MTDPLTRLRRFLREGERRNAFALLAAAGLFVIAGAVVLGPTTLRALVGVTHTVARTGPDRATDARSTGAHGQVPVVCIDQGHHEMHRAGGTYARFAEWLRSDGFEIEAFGAPFEKDALDRCQILVVANALHPRNRIRGEQTDWSLPTPSAFSVDEIEQVESWVEGGGGLLLIADHMPFPGAARDLAAAFGIRFSNGFAVDTAVRGRNYGPYQGTSRFTFHRRDGSLASHPITDGWGDAPRVDSVVTFTGQVFQASGGVDPLLVAPPTTISLLPQEAWQFDRGTPVVEARRWLQGAAVEVGDGRVVVLGEAAQFRPDDDGESRGANASFARNVVAWLADRGRR